MEILFLLTLLQIKHYYADFVIQTYTQTIKKGIWLNPCGISHSLDHVWNTLIVLLIFNLFFPLTIIDIVIVGLAEGVLHYIIDFVKVKYGSKDMTRSLFWHEFGLDQLAHQLTYILIIYYLLLV